MATATKSQGKATFVKKFLQSNPQGNVQTVKEAWTAAGMNGTIGDTLIYELRKQLGLSGKSKPRTAAKKESGTKVSKSAASPGKSMFVKEFLNDHPQGSVASVNRAWKAAGFGGSISKTVIYKVKSSLGLRENHQSKTSSAGKKRGRPRKETSAAISVKPRTNNIARTSVLHDLEADIDRLIFKAMAIGDLTEIEDSLRRTRRLLYGASTRG